MRQGRLWRGEIVLSGERNLDSIQRLFQECGALGQEKRGSSSIALQYPLPGHVLQEKASITTTTPSPMTTPQVSLAGAST